MKKLLSVLITVSIITSGLGALAASPSPAPTAQPSETSEPQNTGAPEATPNTDIQAADTELNNSKSNETSLSSSASPSPTPDVPAQELSKEFKLDINVVKPKHIISNNAVVELYSENGELLGSRLRYIGWDTPSVSMVFDVPQYRMGEKFTVKLVSGLRSLKYYDTVIKEGESVEVQTYGYYNENKDYIQNNGCAMDANPYFDKELCIYIGGNLIQNVSPHARIVDDVAMAPVRAVGEAIGLKVRYDANYDSVVCSIGSDEVIFNANSAYTTILGQDTYAPHAAVYLDGSLFVPVRTLAEAFGSSLDVLDFGDHFDIVISESPMVREYRNRTPVNKNGISSRTDYLVWVSKHEYKVRVYEGSQYHWDLLKEFPCALGAWDTPTITGQFEYIERTRWDYPGYYVGPVLRFYNGYALHSTLLYYGGGEYDGRVGVNISHGCIRLHPQDINWIANTIPFKTRIYITE